MGKYCLDKMQEAIMNKAIHRAPTDPKLSTDLYSAVEEESVTPENFIDQIARKLNVDDAKASQKKQNLMAILMMAVIGPGGAMAVLYATRDQSKDNATKVEALKIGADKLEPRVEAVERSILGIQDSIKVLPAMATGIKDLNEEKTQRIKDKIEKLETENRELRRKRRK